MSHTTTINAVKVTSIAAMERAVQALNQRHGLNLKLTRNGQCTLWYEKKQCAFVVDVPGVQRNLNVGFEGTEATGYSPVFDAHGGWIAAKIGGGQKLAKTAEEHQLSHIGALMHAYATEVVRDVAGVAGAAITEEFNPATGEMVMQLA